MPETTLSSPSLPTTRAPKVFISYSWTSPGHQLMVRDWAERLLSDGVEVVVDIFDLKEGHDKFHFMERVVTDKEITHVLVICDKVYAEKADDKKAGVGTETQIISSEVYAKVAQEKFIPVACEFSEHREPFLPLFLKSRIWIDFSSMEAVNQNWEKLIRLLYGKPAFQKPQTGMAPAYITAEASSPSSPALGKYATFRQAFLSNTKGLSSYRQDFLSASLEFADSLRVRKKPFVDGMDFGRKVLEDCGKLKRVRDQLVDWVLLESNGGVTGEFEESILKLLEDLLELRARPAELNQWSDHWFEAHRVFVYETFLYLIAALLKTGSYKTLHEVFLSHYLRPKIDRSGHRDFENFGAFWGHSEALQSVLAPERQKLYSPAAELITRQADRIDLPLSAVIEADLLSTLMALIMPEVRWVPQTIYYSSQADFAFFVKATRHRDFSNLAVVTGLPDADVLRAAAKEGYEHFEARRTSAFFMLNRSVWECLNMDKLDTLR